MGCHQLGVRHFTVSLVAMSKRKAACEEEQKALEDLENEWREVKEGFKARGTEACKKLKTAYEQEAKELKDAFTGLQGSEKALKKQRIDIITRRLALSGVHATKFGHTYVNFEYYFYGYSSNARNAHCYVVISDGLVYSLDAYGKSKPQGSVFDLELNSPSFSL